MHNKVTVIIPTRNREKLLMDRAVSSVEKQTFQGFEQIVIDDDSDLPPAIECVINIGRKGLSFNRNLGAILAKTEYIVHLDDDNMLEPNHLEETVKFLDDHPEYDAVGVGKTVVYPEGKMYQPPPEGDYFAMNDGFLIRRKAFLDIQCDEDLNANEDADFGLHFLKKYKVGRIDKPLMTVWGSAIINRSSFSDYTDYHLEGLVKFWLKNRNDLPEKDNHYYKRMIGRMFILSTDRPRWFRPIYWLEQKIKRYFTIWTTR